MVGRGKVGRNLGWPMALHISSGGLGGGRRVGIWGGLWLNVFHQVGWDSWEAEGG